MTSPGDTAAAIDRKARAWLRFGAQLVWVVDPLARTVSVFTAGGDHRLLDETDTNDADPALPAFERRVRDFFS